MVRKVKIIDAESGEQLRETYTPATPMLFGFLTPSDVLKFGSAAVMIVVFFVNGQNDKKIMQENLTAMQISVSRLTDFKENSDAWDSQVFGTRFRNGEPIDSNFKLPNKSGG